MELALHLRDKSETWRLVRCAWCLSAVPDKLDCLVSYDFGRELIRGAAIFVILSHVDVRKPYGMTLPFLDLESPLRIVLMWSLLDSFGSLFR